MSLKRSAGTIKCRYPYMLQMEQLQSPTSIFAGATTSKRTRPQWQPPKCVAMGATPLVLVFLCRQISDQRKQTFLGAGRFHIGDVFAIDDESRDTVDAIALHQFIGPL